ncbi:universal stress protein [Streptomyces platensis]|uniref:universal stress protein n=1 Tax=Streptomyces platensis TaxID=58346 RepID=UPI001F35DB98|nr:universal stress protein [Streptomyces platensis]MCF3145482.1 universal stress protein [Streptomyces platensis]
MNNATAAVAPVLVGVEQGSPQQDIVRYAAQQARLHHSPLHILHVSQTTGSGEGNADRESEAASETRGASVVESFKELARREYPDVAVSAETVSGRPAEVLLERSSTTSSLVLGHRGSGGFPRLPLGSVSWQVATHAECPVLVIRPHESLPAPERRVAVGVDIADISEEALDQAYTEAAARGARLELLHANFHFSELPTGPGMIAPDFKALDESARCILETAAAERRERFPEVPTDIRVERVRPSTLLTEASQRVALLVVGSHGRTGLRRLMLGSVSAETLHTASCPVLVVPPATRA